MDLKDTLKQLKMNESRISAVLGALVVIVVGVMVVNYFRNLRPGTTTPTAVNTENTATSSADLKHTIQKGDSLWSIAQKYYNNGFRWTEIKEVNKLTDADVLTEGRELVIPNVSAASIVQVSPTPKAVPSSTPQAITQAPQADSKDTISGNSYTVVKGDNLWDIAVKAYGDGFQWTKIAQANKLANPRLIHTGNVFTIPR
ncbi:MAG: Mannose-binding lectin [Candidatus Woesebacteria bacterium GW2011_GWB1_38_5b]|uniref:Mannose-binding lectin n=1 Tax=Candidatus Woesebacteria bacterium GW2011_GWB1_38_5b TaxID=1618569 RepID=A0A0G0K8E1_9BACT|nr:MAG: Mannose-binding lectin [Candidatus Woesebacteria bacterium GW2011_GWB1_38_5b]KKQ76853.1 MAG: Mannose-binding lectin [Parcubacteria group bacterium GW2011_GWA1_38_7]